MFVPETLDGWIRLATFLPIVICSVVGLALTLAKWSQLQTDNVPNASALDDIRRGVVAREYRHALAAMRADASRGARLIEYLLTQAGRSRTHLREGAERVGRQLADRMEHGIGGIALTATLGPLLGLFGTVVGIIIVFNRLAATGGLATPEQLAAAAGTALYTTVAGLIVGVCGLVSHRYIASLAYRSVRELEVLGQEWVDLLTGDDA